MTLVSNQDSVALSVFPSTLLDVYRKLRIGEFVGVQQSNSWCAPSTQRFVGDTYFPKGVPRGSALAFCRWLTSKRVVVSASRGFATLSVMDFRVTEQLQQRWVMQVQNRAFRTSGVVLRLSTRGGTGTHWNGFTGIWTFHAESVVFHGKCSFRTSSSEVQKWTSPKVSVSVFPELFVLVPSSSSSTRSNRITSVYVCDGFNLC